VPSEAQKLLIQKLDTEPQLIGTIATNPAEREFVQRYIRFLQEKASRSGIVSQCLTITDSFSVIANLHFP
jgi:hypothetical protein